MTFLVHVVKIIKLCLLQFLTLDDIREHNNIDMKDNGKSVSVSREKHFFSGLYIGSIIQHHAFIDYLNLFLF